MMRGHRIRRCRVVVGLRSGWWSHEGRDPQSSVTDRGRKSETVIRWYKCTHRCNGTGTEGSDIRVVSSTLGSQTLVRRKLMGLLFGLKCLSFDCVSVDRTTWTRTDVDRDIGHVVTRMVDLSDGVSVGLVTWTWPCTNWVIGHTSTGTGGYVGDVVGRPDDTGTRVPECLSYHHRNEGPVVHRVDRSEGEGVRGSDYRSGHCGRGLFDVVTTVFEVSDPVVS